MPGVTPPPPSPYPNTNGSCRSRARITRHGYGPPSYEVMSADTTVLPSGPSQTNCGYGNLVVSFQLSFVVEKYGIPACASNCGSVFANPNVSGSHAIRGVIPKRSSQ